MAEELERARKAMRELSKTLKSLPKDPPPGEVHKLRTATRRVEAIVSVLAQVEGKESRRLLKSIEPIRKAAGGVREMDVMIGNARKLARYAEGDSLTRLVEQLQIGRQQNAVELRRVLDRQRAAARQKLKDYSSLIRTTAAHAKRTASANVLPANAHEGIHSAAANVVRELGAWPPLNAENIHAFRLKVKELRYILQLSSDANSELGEALGNVQRRIGDWHDWHQLHEIASQILTPERGLALFERIDETTKRKFDQALVAANGLRGKYLSMPVAQGA
jgi:CHAD domain-containing protein